MSSSNPSSWLAGANFGLFTLVRGVALKPLVNRARAGLIYIRQEGAPGACAPDKHFTFSVPELKTSRSIPLRFRVWAILPPWVHMVAVSVSLAEVNGWA